MIRKILFRLTAICMGIVWPIHSQAIRFYKWRISFVYQFNRSIFRYAVEYDPETGEYYNKYLRRISEFMVQYVPQGAAYFIEQEIGRFYWFIDRFVLFFLDILIILGLPELIFCAYWVLKKLDPVTQLFTIVYIEFFTYLRFESQIKKGCVLVCIFLVLTITPIIIAWHCVNVGFLPPSGEAYNLRLKLLTLQILCYFPFFFWFIGIDIVKDGHYIWTLMRHNRREERKFRFWFYTYFEKNNYFANPDEDNGLLGDRNYWIAKLKYYESFQEKYRNENCWVKKEKIERCNEIFSSAKIYFKNKNFTKLYGVVCVYETLRSRYKIFQEGDLYFYVAHFYFFCCVAPLTVVVGILAFSDYHPEVWQDINVFVFSPEEAAQVKDWVVSHKKAWIYFFDTYIRGYVYLVLCFTLLLLSSFFFSSKAIQLVNKTRGIAE